MINTPHAKQDTFVRFSEATSPSTASGSGFLPRGVSRPPILVQDFRLRRPQHITINPVPIIEPEKPFESDLELHLRQLKTLRTKTLRSSPGHNSMQSLTLTPSKSHLESALSCQTNRLRLRIMVRTADKLIFTCKHKFKKDIQKGLQLTNTEDGIRKSVQEIMTVGLVKVKQGFNISRKKFLEDEHLLTRVQIKRMIADVRMKIKRARNDIN